jgi:hypothetical protein
MKELETCLDLTGLYKNKDTLGVINVSKVSEGVIHGWTAIEWPKCGREHERKSTARRGSLPTLGRKEAIA